MTEAEWLACDEVGRLIEYLDGLPNTRRKLDWFDVACCRQVWHLLADELSRYAINSLESRPIEEQSDEEFEALRGMTSAAATLDEPSPSSYRAALAVHQAVMGRDTEVAESCVRALAGDDGIVRDHETRRQVSFLRDIFGNPFRPVTLDPSWRTSTVLALAEGIYADHAFDRLPILADALQDAGCEDAAILDHCRGPGPHVRGCWVVDLLLGKE